MIDSPITFVLIPDGATDSFQAAVSTLQGDTFAPYLFIVVVDYVLRIALDPISNHGLTLQKGESSYHPSKPVMDFDYADDIALLANQINNAETLVQFGQ